MNVGTMLAKLRTENGLNQRALAQALGVSNGAIAMWETNKRQPDLETTEKIANYFGVSVDYLLGRTENKFPGHVLEWQYPLVSNRLGTILKKYRNKNNLSEQVFAEQLNVNIDTYMGIEIGKFSPSLQLFQKISEITHYDMDYLTGAVDSIDIPTGKSIEINNMAISMSTTENNFHFKARFEELCMKHNITCENVTKILGLTHQEYIDITLNRMPTLSELLRIAYAFKVSIDYLVGKTDTPFSNLSEDELNLILNYRDCITIYKKIILERAEKLAIESTTLSVAADEALEKTGTDNQGK